MGSRPLRVLVAAALALVLAGCASVSESAPSPTPTVTVSANRDACRTFADATAEMADALNADAIKVEWAKVRDQMDSASLEASGDVKLRLNALVKGWPDGARLWLNRDFEGLNTMLKDVGRACKADGASVEYRTFVSE